MSRGAAGSRREWSVLGGALLAAAAVRAAFLAFLGLPPFDPWRHLLLIRNLRAGAGFTLFDGQPYIWYGEAWYRLCAWAPEWLEPQRLAGLLSCLSVAAFWLWLRGTEAEGDDRSTALAGAWLAAGFGPLVAFSCHYGPEAFALFCLLAALAAAAALPGVAAAAGAGLLFGVSLVARMNLVFDAFLFLPVLRSRGRWLAFAGGASLPLAAAWWRNHRAIASYPYLFTWDGLATRTADFNPVSTLVLQLHPAIREGLKRLHSQIVPVPEWIKGPDGIAWGPLSFMVLGVACLLACRRWHLLLAGLTTLGYYLFLDGSRSSNFFRIWLGLFPVLLAAVAVVAARVARSRLRGGALAAWGLVAAALLSGAGFLQPQTIGPVELVTPAPELLVEEAYLVNSTFYHPESLIFRFPEKRFVGMPLDPGQFEEFRGSFPSYRFVLWHDFSVQDALLDYLLGAGGYGVVRTGANPYGRRYAVLGPKGASGIRQAAPADASGRSTR